MAASKKVAVYTGSRNIYSDMVMSAKSLTAFSDVDKIYFLIEDDIFPEELPDHIETINMSGQQYFDPWGPNMTTNFTYFAMLRAALGDIFNDYDRILSLDCDTVCVRDVSHLWELPIDDYYFSASIEPHRSTCGLIYTNVGVCLMNLDKLRTNEKTDEFIDVLNRQKFTFVDQDVMNYLCQGYIYEMNSEYNANNFTKPCQNPRIIHFAGMKRDNWLRHPKAKYYNEISWDDIFKLQKQNKSYPS